MTFKVTREGELAGRGELVKTCGNSPRSRKFQRKTRLKSGCKKKRRSLSKKAPRFTFDSARLCRGVPLSPEAQLPSSQTSAKTTHRYLYKVFGSGPAIIF